MDSIFVHNHDITLLTNNATYNHHVCDKKLTQTVIALKVSQIKLNVMYIKI